MGLSRNDRRPRLAVAPKGHLSDGCPCGATAQRRALAAAFVCVVTIAGCTSPPSPKPHVDAKLDLYNTTARLEFADGRPAEAADAYTLALDRADVLDDPAASTTAAYSLAIARAAAYDYSGALAALDIAAYDARRANIDPTDLLLVRARVELLHDDPRASSDAADQVLAEPRSKPTPLRQAQSHVIKGLCACRENDATVAKSELDAATALVGSTDSPSMHAMLAGLSGEIHLLAKDNVAASVDFDRQAELSRQAADYRTMCIALAKAGRAYGNAGNASFAADRLYRAARASVSSNSRDAAALVGEALAAAQHADDPRITGLCNQLLNRLKASNTTGYSSN